MALLFCDSFDTTETGQQKWTMFNGVSYTTGRTNQGLQVSGSLWPIHTLPLSTDGYRTITAGFAFKATSFSNSIIYFYNPNNTVTPVHLTFTSSKLSVLLHGGFSDTDTSGALGSTLSANTWYYVEVKFTMGSLNVTYQVRLDGQVIGTGILDVDSSDYTDTTGYTTFGLQGPGGGHTAVIDDLYVTTGEFLGAVKIYYIRPDSDPTPNNWTTSTGTVHYTLVDETVANEDTDYITTTATGSEEITTLTDIDTFSKTVKGIQINWVTKKTESGPMQYIGEYVTNTNTKTHTWLESRIVGTTTITTTNSSVHPSMASYDTWLAPLSSNVVTGAAWTIGEINALKIGIKRTT